MSSYSYNGSWDFHLKPEFNVENFITERFRFPQQQQKGKMWATMCLHIDMTYST